MDLKLNTLTFGQLATLQEKISAENFFYTSSFNVIGKHVLKILLYKNVFQMTFEEIKNEYLKEATISSKNNVPETEEAFYKYICESLLHIDKEPYQSLLELYIVCSKDLEELDKNLSELHQRMEELNNKKKKIGNLNDEERYNINLYNYYKELNENAKKEIIYFLTYKIKKYLFTGEIVNDSSKMSSLQYKTGLCG